MLWLSHPPRCPHGGWHLSFTPAGLIGCRSGYFCMSLWQWQTSCAGQPPPQKDDPSTNKGLLGEQNSHSPNQCLNGNTCPKLKPRVVKDRLNLHQLDVARLVLMYCFTTSRQFCLSPLPKVVNLFSRLQLITSLFFRTLPLWATVTDWQSIVSWNSIPTVLRNYLEICFTSALHCPAHPPHLLRRDSWEEFCLTYWHTPTSFWSLFQTMAILDTPWKLTWNQKWKWIENDVPFQLGDV